MAVTNQRKNASSNRRRRRAAVVSVERSAAVVVSDDDFSSSDEFLLKCSDRPAAAEEDDGVDDYEGSIARDVVQCRTRPSLCKKISRSISSVNEKAACSKSQLKKGSPTITDDAKEFDAKEFLDKRVMTSAQERFNAITMLPGMIYSVYFILAGCWMDHGGNNIVPSQQNNNEWADLAREAFGNNGHIRMENFGCINSPTFPSLKALPPSTIVAAALGILVHSPFSMMYHWKCATTLGPSERIRHWSRRLDNGFIHFASTCAAYATTGRIDYLLANAAFNADCAYRQFEEEVRPRRNLVRIAVSILLYLLPVLAYGHYELFLQFILMFALCGWLFVQYPFGGWSHGMFHLVLSLLPHLVMGAAMRLESSRVQIDLAMRCGEYASSL